jgi:hypothetical protein
VTANQDSHHVPDKCLRVNQPSNRISQTGPGFFVKRQDLDTEKEKVKMALTARQDEAVVETQGEMGKHLKWHIMPAMTTSGDGCHPSGSRGFN